MGIHKSRKEEDVRNNIRLKYFPSREDKRKLMVIERGNKVREQKKTDFMWGRI